MRATLITAAVLLFANSGEPINAAGETRDVALTFKMLGSNAPLAKFSFVVLIPTDKGFARTTKETGDDGRCTITVPKDVEARLYACGDYFIPASWATIRKDMTQADVFVRPLKRVRASGKAVSADGKALPAASVTFAPLDQLPDGTMTPHEVPYVTICDPRGAYELDVPAGFYQVWASWNDVSSDVSTAYFTLERRVDIFSDLKLDLKLPQSPRMKGRVLDGRTGKPMSCILDLYSHAWLKQVSIFTGDETGWNDLPTGVFDTQARTVDTSGFAVVLREAGVGNAVRVYPGMDIDKLNASGDLVLYDTDAGKLDCKLVTADKEFPVAGMDLDVLPSGQMKVPPFLHEALTLSEYTDDGGAVSFWGLPEGRYTLYCMEGEVLLGEFAVSGKPQALTAKLAVPFAYGTITYPDGTACTKSVVEVTFKLADGKEGRPMTFDAFRNRKLAGEGKFFVPFRWDDASYTLRFWAPDQNAKELPFVLNVEEFPFMSEAITVTPDGPKGYEKTIKLAANPKAKKEEEKKE